MRRKHPFLRSDPAALRSLVLDGERYLDRKMRQLAASLSLCLAIGLWACSPDYKVNIQVGTRDLIGEWVLASASESVLKALGTNWLSASTIRLKPDGSAVYQFLPVEELRHSTPIPASIWSLASGTGRWDLSDWGNRGRHTWRIALE